MYDDIDIMCVCILFIYFIFWAMSYNIIENFSPKYSAKIHSCITCEIPPNVTNLGSLII